MTTADPIYVINLKWNLIREARGEYISRHWRRRDALAQAGHITGKIYAGPEGVHDAIKDLSLIIDGRKVK